MPPASFFEHIALVVHLDDLVDWGAWLRGPLGGRAAMGGVEPRAGFQGGQVTYPDGGMLELITWTPREPDAKPSANERYLAKQGGARAALHHLTFLVDDIDAAIAHCESVGYAPMVGRQGRNWSEFFVKEPALLPPGLLLQVLRADKDALAKQGWRTDWEPFTQPALPAPAVRIEGVHLACSDAAPARRVFTSLLGAEPEGDALRFGASSMRVWLHEGEAPSFGHVQLSERRGRPPVEADLFR
ncbi:MAG: VOC family protein [Myxococcota bacterium]